MVRSSISDHYILNQNPDPGILMNPDPDLGCAESGSGTRPRFLGKNFVQNLQLEIFLDRKPSYYVFLNPDKGLSGSSNMNFFPFVWWTALTCLDPDPLILLNPDPKHW